MRGLAAAWLPKPTGWTPSRVYADRRVFFYLSRALVLLMAVAGLVCSAVTNSRQKEDIIEDAVGVALWSLAHLVTTVVLTAVTYAASGPDSHTVVEHIRDDVTDDEAATRRLSGDEDVEKEELPSLTNGPRSCCSLALSVLGGLWFTFACLLVVSNTIAETAQRDPPGTLFNIDGKLMHMHCTGSRLQPEDPLVLFFHGFGGQMLDSARLRLDMDSSTRFCAFDRRGYGWSERGDRPRSSDTFALETWALLEASGEDTSRIFMMGHSFAGHNMRLFRAQAPQRIVAMVAIDTVMPKGRSRTSQFIKLNN